MNLDSNFITIVEQVNNCPNMLIYKQQVMVGEQIYKNVDGEVIFQITTQLKYIVDISCIAVMTHVRNALKVDK